MAKKTGNEITTLTGLRDAVKALLAYYGLESRFYVQQMIWADAQKPKLKICIYDFHNEGENLSNDYFITPEELLFHVEESLKRKFNQKELFKL